MALNYQIGHIHGSSKIYGKLKSYEERQITIRCSDWNEQKKTFRELLEFFTKTHGHSFDSNTIGDISYRSLEEHEGSTTVNRFAWSYQVPKTTRHLVFYVTKDSLATFRFWYPDGKTY
jgi:hypothetical protein